MKAKFLRLSFLILLLPVVSFSQYKEKEVVEFLSGTKYKLWFLDKYEVVMGGSNTCEKGKAYTFHEDGKLEYKECIDGKWQNKEYQYTLKTEDTYDWWISFDNKEYYLVLKNASAYQEVRLRDYGDDPNSKIEAANDIVLKHLIDD